MYRLVMATYVGSSLEPKQSFCFCLNHNLVLLQIEIRPDIFGLVFKQMKSGPDQMPIKYVCS